MFPGIMFKLDPDNVANPALEAIWEAMPMAAGVVNKLPAGKTIDLFAIMPTTRWVDGMCMGHHTQPRQGCSVHAGAVNIELVTLAKWQAFSSLQTCTVIISRLLLS